MLHTKVTDDNITCVDGQVCCNFLGMVGTMLWTDVNTLQLHYAVISTVLHFGVTFSKEFTDIHKNKQKNELILYDSREHWTEIKWKKFSASSFLVFLSKLLGTIHEFPDYQLPNLPFKFLIFSTFFKPVDTMVFFYLIGQIQNYWCLFIAHVFEFFEVRHI